MPDPNDPTPSPTPHPDETCGSALPQSDLPSALESALDRGLAAAFGEPAETRECLSRADGHVGMVVAGKYHLIQQIGEGGMGSVWLAEQRQPVKRNVALKLIKAGMDSRAVLARFDAERQALALMDHPNIARILDGGLTEWGSPFFVMELVKGAPITEYCDARRLTPRERLELFVPVCQAIQHAHQKGIIHRDIKPSNVLVALYDDRPVPKVIDFGLAKATGQALTEQTLNTGFHVIGTPQYMSPEQATFNQLDIDTRSDIYSLGVLLYELLAGTPPFKTKELEQAALLEILRMIREDEPPRPSTKASSSAGLPSISACRGTEPRKLTGLLRNELDWIVMKALEKNRSRRYETANGFAADITRYLTGEAVLAHPPSLAYRLQKFLRRHKGPVLATCLVFVALVAGIVGTSYGLFQAEQQRTIAIHNETKALQERAKAIAAAESETAQRIKAEAAEEATLAAYRESTDDAIEHLIGSKDSLGRHERAYLENSLQRWKAFAERAGDDERSRAIRAEGHFRVGNLWRALGRLDEARLEFEQALIMQKELAADFSSKPEYQVALGNTHNNLGTALDHVKRQDDALTQYRQAAVIWRRLVRDFPEVPEYRDGLTNAYHNLGVLLYYLGRLDEARTELESAVAIEQALPSDIVGLPANAQRLANTHHALGGLFARRGQHNEAQAQFNQAIHLEEQLVAAFPAEPSFKEGLARVRGALGDLLEKQGHAEEAREQFEQSLAMRESLVKEFPAVPMYRRDLAMLHNNRGAHFARLRKWDEAEADYQHALAIWQPLAEEFPNQPDYQYMLSSVQHNLAVLLGELGKTSEARVAFLKELATRQMLVAEFNDVPEYQDHLAHTHHDLAASLMGTGQLAEAKEHLEQSRRILIHLVSIVPDAPGYLASLSATQADLAKLLNDLGQPEEARDAYNQALAIRKKLVEDFPADAKYRFDLGSTRNNLANLFFGLKQWDAAQAEYQQALVIWKQLVGEFPNTPEYRVELARSRHNFGNLLSSSGRPAEAQAEYEQALEIRKQLAIDAPDAAQWQQDLADTCMELGGVMMELGTLDQARAYYEQTIEINQRAAPEIFASSGTKVALGGTYCNLGLIATQQGQITESLPWFELAIRTLTPLTESDPANLTARSFLRNSYANRAAVYDELKNHLEANRDWDRAVDLSSLVEQPRYRASRTVSRLLAGQVSQAVADLEELTKTGGWSAIEWYNFACVYSVASGKIADKRQEFADRAMEMLKQSVEAGWTSTDQIKQDTDLDPLRSRDDFKQLIAELEGRVDKTKE